LSLRATTGQHELIAVRLLERRDWEKQLRERGCKPCAEGQSRKIQTAEWWVSVDGKVFTVPIEGSDDRCEMWAFKEILDRLNRGFRPTIVRD
jgi:hypothetical protein